MAGGATGRTPGSDQDAEAGARGELGPLAFAGMSLGKTRHGRRKNLGLASLNNFSGRCAVGVVLSQLLPGPRVIKAKEHCLLGCMARRSRYALDCLVYLPDVLLAGSFAISKN